MDSAGEIIEERKIPTVGTLYTKSRKSTSKHASRWKRADIDENRQSEQAQRNLLQKSNCGSLVRQRVGTISSVCNTLKSPMP